MNRYVDDLGCSIGDELLKPTQIYVKPVLALLDRDDIRIKALAHITSTGFLNLSRGDAPFGFVLDSLPDAPPIFRLIQCLGHVTDEEMFFVFNMGIGFCVVVAPDDADAVISTVEGHGLETQVVGYAVEDPLKQIEIPSRRLIGRDGKFFPV